MTHSDLDGVATLAALNEPLRRRIYDCVADQVGGVSREKVATTLGVARSVAAFHLDKLVGAGLLEVEQRRPPGRNGPGAGRPAKWYRRAAGEVSVSVPERRYALAAALLAEAVARAASSSLPVADALRAVAREHGRFIGAALSRAAAGPVADRLVEVLAEHGYEPCRSEGAITLRNCPFRVLAAEHRRLVCDMNLELLCGLVEAAGLPAGIARIDPAPGRCCVTLAA